MNTNEHEPSRAHKQGEMVLYQTADGTIKVECVFVDENLWLTQGVLAELFGVQAPAVSKHLKNIFDAGELVEEAVLSILETTASDGKTYRMKYYNLDAIIAVGYRVNSYEATQFRIWATKTLKEFMVKGFVLDDERLKQGKTLLARTTSTNCSSASGRSGPANGAFTRRSRISTRWPSIMTRTRRSPATFLPQSRISCTGRSPARRPPRPSTRKPMLVSRTWA